MAMARVSPGLQPEAMVQVALSRGLPSNLSRVMLAAKASVPAPPCCARKAAEWGAGLGPGAPEREMLTGWFQGTTEGVM